MLDSLLVIVWLVIPIIIIPAVILLFYSERHRIGLFKASITDGTIEIHLFPQTSDTQ